jgi:OOP family OmpA-OmpF porin
MRRSKVVIAAGLVLLLLAFVGGANAEDAPLKRAEIDVSPFVGYYWFEGNQNLDNSLFYGVALGYRLGQHFGWDGFGLEGVFGYTNPDYDKNRTVFVPNNVPPEWGTTVTEKGDDTNVYQYRLDAVYNFLNWDRLVPYVAAGIGGITYDASESWYEDDGTSFLVNYGGGLKYYFAQNWAVRGDVRHIISFSEHRNNLAATAGVTYTFGREYKMPCVDSDGDGVCDDKDECPNTPAGMEVDERGCGADSDGDGVPDYLDKCPGTPKGVRVDLSGCPVDSDGDGVPDYLDKCPGTPAGVPVDSDGCPRDSDGDGIPDYRDKCPGTPKGVVVDSDGCPIDSDGDGVPDYRDKCPGTPLGAPVNDVGCWILKNVQFDTNKATVKQKYFYRLDEAVVVMNKNPSMSVEIQGHTDNVGTAEYNQKLSERRAQAVLEYFVGKGIDGSRLTAVGFGFADPVASNDTEAGRYQNRRVQLKPIY